MAPKLKKTRKAMKLSPAVVPNQVFLGVPWHNVRSKYERSADKLRPKSPLSFVIVGRKASQDADDLLLGIKSAIEGSSYAIFDATAGNPNVSLEFGYAEAMDIPRALYVSTHAAAKQSTDAPIIADLAGKRRNQYAQEKALHKLLEDFSRDHPYTKRFEAFLKQSFSKVSKGKKKRARSLALKVIHTMDRAPAIRRVDLVQLLLADQSAYTLDEIDAIIKKLHSAGLIRSLQGPHSKVTIT